MTTVPVLDALPTERDAGPFDPPRDITRLREARPVSPMTFPDGHRGWVVTGYDAVRRLMADTRFSSRLDIGVVHMPYETPGMPTPTEPSPQPPGMFIAMDPPDHTRLRRMLIGAFTVKRMRQLECHIVEIVGRALDEMSRLTPPVDLVKEFALPVPSLVICELLGVPYSDRAEFQERSSRLLDMSLSPEERMAVARENRDYMSSLVGRAEAEPGEDILGMLVREHGADLTHDELTGIAGLLLIAGHETTSNMLGLGTLALLRDPEQLALVRDDPAMARPAVEELMRYLSIVHTGVPRTTTADVELRGTMIPKGSLVMCSLPAANRDPEVTTDPDRLDVRRGAAGHVAFGHGVHHCLGAPLARMEMETAFPALLRRFPNLAVAPGHDDAEFRAYHFIYGLHSLPVTW